jgi:hypothetical protein
VIATDPSEVTRCPCHTMPPRASRERRVAAVLSTLTAFLVCLSCSSTEVVFESRTVFHTVDSGARIVAPSLPVTVGATALLYPTLRRTEFGFEDTTSGVVVKYFADRGASSAPVSDADPLATVVASWTLNDDSVAVRRWRDFQSRLEKVLAREPRCWRAMPSGRPGERVAVWDVSGARVFARALGTDSLLTARGWIRQPPEVSVGVSLDSAILNPLMSRLERVDCASGR